MSKTSWGTLALTLWIALTTPAGVSVVDPSGEPIRNLQIKDFTVSRGIRKGRVLSVEPLQASKAVPVNLVLVIDNSFSMYERHAVQPLLTALEELLKGIRPIDNVHAVVFSDRETRLVGKRLLNVRTFTSTNAAEWKAFFAEAFDRGLTSKTYLYEGIAAGLDIVKRMPARQEKLLAVFSDGEDLNSKLSKGEVAPEAAGIGKLRAYSIDYMPGERLDEFLSGFARGHGGRTWKARSAAELVPIFQELKSTILHKYVVTYELLNPITLEPKTLTFDVPVTTTGRPAAQMVFFPTGRSDLPPSYALYKTRTDAEAFRPDEVSGFLSRCFNLLNFAGKAMRDVSDAQLTLVGCTSETGVEKDNLKLAQARAETVKDYLVRVWGVSPSRVLIEARGLPAEASPADTRDGRLENQRVELVFDNEAARSLVFGALVSEARNQRALGVKLDLYPLPAVTKAELAVQADERPLKVIPLGTRIPASQSVPLDELGRNRLVKLNAVEAAIRVTDGNGVTHEASSDLCQLRVNPKVLVPEIGLPPYGSLRLEPRTVTVEEITVVESSPLLNMVYFESGRAEIPARYHQFRSAADARSFDEKALRGTMEKYRHVLDIIGKRTAERPRARLKIVGCNSGFGDDKSRPELARSRAEAVRGYLKAIWGVEVARMEVEARGLPAVASAAGIPEGRAENQRVEIHADDPAILDTVQSTYVESVSDAEKFRMALEIEPGVQLGRWKIEIYGDEQRLEGLNGEGAPEPSYVLDLKDLGLLNVGSYRTITAALEGADSKGRTLRARDTAQVRFVRREERLARKEGYKVVERYALILFDFDRADIKDRNRVVMDRIAGRVRELPSASVAIVGHTDTIGKPDYNVGLSRKRAEAAGALVLAAEAGARSRVSVTGKGPADPLFDNA
ncbi:MAG: OmpA family protein, partial [Desulfobacterales bacterium]|nr:OmpA family protein [Desulfobacterales bacterium]